MKILMCSLPVVSLSKTLTPVFPKRDKKLRNQPALPGILRINTWMEKNGYESDIYDINNLRPSDEELQVDSINLRRINVASFYPRSLTLLIV